MTGISCSVNRRDTCLRFVVKNAVGTDVRAGLVPAFNAGRLGPAWSSDR